MNPTFDQPWQRDLKLEITNRARAIRDGVVGSPPVIGAASGAATIYEGRPTGRPSLVGEP